jgi:hypothetical protein
LAKAGLSPEEFATRANVRRGKIVDNKFTNQYSGAEKGDTVAVDVGGKTYTMKADTFQRLDKVVPQAGAQPPGLVEPGNIDLSNRRVVPNADGTVSTVRSFSVNIDGKETLLPQISPTGKVWSQQEAIANYRKTGQHLGKFDSVASANAYAQQVHQDQATKVSDPRIPLAQKALADPNASEAHKAAARKILGLSSTNTVQSFQGGGVAGTYPQGLGQEGYEGPFPPYASAIGDQVINALNRHFAETDEDRTYHQQIVNSTLYDAFIKGIPITPMSIMRMAIKDLPYEDSKKETHGPAAEADIGATFSKGGKVKGTDTGKDTVTAKLEPGEVVFNLQQLPGIAIRDESLLRRDQIIAIQNASPHA